MSAGVASAGMRVDVPLDRGQREAVALQLADQLEPGDVVGAVVARATAADRRRDQALGGVEADVAHAHPDARRSARRASAARCRRPRSPPLHPLLASDRHGPSDGDDTPHLLDGDSNGVTIRGHGRSIRLRPHPHAARQGQGRRLAARGQAGRPGRRTARRAQDPQPRLDPTRVDDVVLGVVSPIGDQGGDIAKTAALAAGYPDTVAGVQLNRFCASGLEAVNQAAPRVRSRLRGPDPRRRRRVDEPRADGLRRRRLGDGPGHRARRPASCRRASAPT